MVVPRYSHRPLEIKKCWMIKLEVGNIRESCFQRVNKLFFANLPTQNYIKCLGPPYTPKKSCTSNPHLMIWGCIFTSYLNLVPPFSGKPLDSRCVCLLDTSPPEVPPKIVVVELKIDIWNNNFRQKPETQPEDLLPKTHEFGCHGCIQSRMCRLHLLFPRFPPSCVKYGPDLLKTACS